MTNSEMIRIAKKHYYASEHGSVTLEMFMHKVFDYLPTKDKLDISNALERKIKVCFLHEDWKSLVEIIIDLTTPTGWDRACNFMVQEWCYLVWDKTIPKPFLEVIGHAA